MQFMMLMIPAVYQGGKKVARWSELQEIVGNVRNWVNAGKSGSGGVV